jgi:hypothetical protein
MNELRPTLSIMTEFKWFIKYSHNPCWNHLLCQNRYSIWRKPTCSLYEASIIIVGLHMTKTKPSLKIFISSREQQHPVSTWNSNQISGKVAFLIL